MGDNLAACRHGPGAGGHHPVRIGHPAAAAAAGAALPLAHSAQGAAAVARRGAGLHGPGAGARGGRTGVPGGRPLPPGGLHDRQPRHAGVPLRPLRPPPDRRAVRPRRCAAPAAAWALQQHQPAAGASQCCELEGRAHAVPYLSPACTPACTACTPACTPAGALHCQAVATSSKDRPPPPRVAQR
jgi:hypothetical protein